MNFYKENAIKYVNDTINIDMSLQYEFVEKYLRKDAYILDVGFGSARDLLYFKSKGYNVYGIDIEQKFVDFAKEKGLDVECCSLLTFNTTKKFDLIWCCASLVHLTFEEIKKALDNLKKYLSNDGVIYLSFKYGDFVGFKGDRYFTYINEERLKGLNIKILDTFISESNIEENLKWINIIGK